MLRNQFDNFDNDELKMATSLLLLVTYYPEFPPLKSFTASSFQGKKEFIAVVEGNQVFADIEECTVEQLTFFENKIKEIPQFMSSVSKPLETITRITIFSSQPI